MNKIKFLIDVNVGIHVENYLTKEDYDIKSVRLLNPRMSDAEILDIAVHEKRIIITMDKDFGELVYNSGHEHSGVLLIRLEDQRPDEKIAALSLILRNYLDRLQDHFCVFMDNRLRIRS